MKKLIVEIDDKYADAVSMSFIGTKCTESEEIHMTVAAVAVKHDVTAVAICEDGSSVGYEGDFAADFEDEEDNAFCLDVAAIDTALAAIKRLIKLEYEKE